MTTIEDNESYPSIFILVINEYKLFFPTDDVDLLMQFLIMIILFYVLLQNNFYKLISSKKLTANNSCVKFI